jgi:mannitol-specific phosphotransferase system IIBC component
MVIEGRFVVMVMEGVCCCHGDRGGVVLVMVTVGRVVGGRIVLLPLASMTNGLLLPR